MFFARNNCTLFLGGVFLLKAVDLRCEYRENPLGMFTKHPRFGWVIDSDETNVLQSSYEIEVAEDESFALLVWKTGQMETDSSVHIKYAGKELESCKKYYYRVKISDNHGNKSLWSETAFFETSILDNAVWQAKFITAETEESAESSAGTMLRKEFTAGKKIASARLYATAKGIYKAFVNGKQVGGQELTPGWTEYKKRLLFQVYNVTAMLESGNNALGIMVGPGWYKGDLAGWIGKRNLYGERTAVLAQLHIKYTDGTEDIIPTGADWKCSSSPVIYSELYNGETYDARLEQKNWSNAGFDDSKWKAAEIESKDLSMLAPQDGLPVKALHEIKPVEIFTTPEGDRVIDFGQNISGWVQFKVKGKAGDKVILRHAETLDSAGNFYTENLRAAKQVIEYILSGEGEESYYPNFTFQGFRYVSIDEYPAEICSENFTAFAIYSDMRQVGDFESSNPLLNKLVQNIRWGMRDNFVDIPTDCPQRDERLGWTGDAQVFVRAASFLMETAPFFRKWLRDLKAAQAEDGGIPHVIPDALKKPKLTPNQRPEGNATGWADVAVVAPWTMYKYFSDMDILAEQYDVMKGWVGYMQANARDGLIWNTGFHFGDWVALDAPAGSRFGATPNDLTATTYYSYSVSLMAKMAKVMGKENDAAEYGKLHDNIVKAYHKEFFTATGRLAARTQTAHVLSLFFGLVPEEYKKRTIDTLAKLIEEQNGLTTGFLGTPYLCHALVLGGRPDIAYDLLMKEDYPSWLYQVTKGATTIWEHWDGLKPDGTMWSASMNSFNHYAYGAVADFIFSTVAGIDTSEEAPGFKKITFAPKPGGGLAFAAADYDSLYGKAAIKWEKANSKIKISVRIPHNTTAELVLPLASAGEYSGIKFAEVFEGAKAELGSGKYEFEYSFAE